MEIFNKTKNITISTNTKTATSFLDKCLGLLNKSNPRSLVFNTRFGIYTFGLCVPIDVVILDEGNKVVKLGISVKPNRIFLWNPKFSMVLELPEKTIQYSKIEIGDTLELVDT